MFEKWAEGIYLIMLFYSLLVIALIAFLTFIVYIYKQRQTQYESKISEFNTILEKSILEAQLEIQEQTFQYISQEIHDNIGQKLSLAKLNLNRYDDSAKAENHHLLVHTVQILTDVIADLRDLSRTMDSELVIQNGLIKALENEISQLNRAGVYKLKLQVIGEGVFLVATKELILFRIVQESLNNIIKHADATEITIRLHYTVSNMILEIEDNGKGYMLEERDGKGNGLGNIRRRALILNGKCRIDTSPGKGTIIQIDIPINGHEQNMEGHTG